MCFFTFGSGTASLTCVCRHTETCSFQAEWDCLKISDDDYLESYTITHLKTLIPHLQPVKNSQLGHLVREKTGEV